MVFSVRDRLYYASGLLCIVSGVYIYISIQQVLFVNLRGQVHRYTGTGVQVHLQVYCTGIQVYM